MIHVLIDVAKIALVLAFALSTGIGVILVASGIERKRRYRALMRTRHADQGRWWRKYEGR